MTCRLFMPNERLGSESLSISNDIITATFSATTGLLDSVTSGNSEVRMLARGKRDMLLRVWLPRWVWL